MRPYFFLIAFLSALLGSCSGQKDASSTLDDSAPVDSGVWHVAVMPTADCLPFFLAADHGFFQAAGLQVSLDCYLAQMDVDTALLHGSASIGITDLVRAQKLERDGLLLRYLTATNASWQLVSNRLARIKKLQQLDDKMVAMTRYSATDLLSDVLVDSGRLKTERVFRIQVNDVGVRKGMLQSGIIDALFLPEPQSTEARLHKHPVLLDTRQMDLQLGAIVATQLFAQQHEDELKTFVSAYNQAVDSLNKQGLLTYRTLLSQRLGINGAVADSLCRSLPPFLPVAQPREKDTEYVKNWWEKRIASMKYVETRYIQ